MARVAADDRARRLMFCRPIMKTVTRFEPALIVQQPGWLGPAASRQPGISHLASWYPLTTFVVILVAAKNAVNVTPGRFAARGYDYRTDLARMISETYRLPVANGELLAIEHALRRREAKWARRHLVAGQLHRPKRLSSAGPKTGPERRHHHCQFRPA